MHHEQSAIHFISGNHRLLWLALNDAPLQSRNGNVAGHAARSRAED